MNYSKLKNYYNFLNFRVIAFCAFKSTSNEKLGRLDNNEIIGKIG